MKLDQLFAELKRRNVYRGAAAYFIGAWLIAQVVTQTFPFFDIPNWVVKTILTCLAVGFPVAMVLSWIYDLTPEGWKHAEEVDQTTPTQRAVGRKIDYAIIVVLLLVIALLVFHSHLPWSAGIPEKSIAVLPFANLSENNENSFFADGVQDDLLTNLAKIKDLKVISRTSVLPFRGARENLRAIAKQLGVANILEGSVRRVGDRVVVNVQLINALKDQHLWANSYDRTIADSLGLEGELASEIADALKATLTPEEKERVQRRPTENADAWTLYLRGREFQLKPDTTLQDLRIAEQLYEQAVQLDPKFALAHAMLSITCASIFHFQEPLSTWKDKARAEANLALRLQPNLAAAHTASAYCSYWFDSDYDSALREFGIARELEPNDPWIVFSIAAIRRRQGKWEEALQLYQRAEQLDPQNPNIVRNILITNTAMRRWDAAARAAARFRQISPESLVARIQSSYVEFFRKDDRAALRRDLANVPAGVDPDGIVTSCRWEGAMLEHDFAVAREILEKSPLEELDYMTGGSTPKSFLLGCATMAAGGNATALFEDAARKFERAVGESPASAECHANLGICYAYLGRHDDAIRAGMRATELKPESTDAFDGALMKCCLALIYARVGEADAAFQLLKELAHKPGAVDTVCYSVTHSDLATRWEWDPLRRDPRFATLLAGTR
ncbi:MAG: tetratricopeptide repeat protein [Verrucomicrobiota bacterium]|nr:tetratricopeptide repeat protein [Verrucomicrobiota bacterium]